jgi:hypothetical protein
MGRGADQIWPHLAADRPAAAAQPRQPSPLASAMYPGLVPPKPKPVDQNREILLRNLRWINSRAKKGR